MIRAGQKGFTGTDPLSALRGRRHDRQRIMNCITVVVPCYCESEGIPDLATALKRLEAQLVDHVEFEFLLVDDGSPDDTFQKLVAHFGGWQNARILRHPQNRGVAGAIMTGIQHAQTDIVCSMDSDCTYDPLQFAALLPQLSHDVAMVTASPYHPEGRVEGISERRLFLSRAASWLYRRILRTKIHTYTSCFRVYRRQPAQQIRLRNNGFIGVAEMIWEMEKRGLRVVEVPAVLTTRQKGESKLRIFRVVRGHLYLLARIAGQRLLGHRVNRS